mmetsp:Transcript_62214/g.103389  ORF Transcript_62214/g.103389 Transcript_62214/m.103389 type:complete len:875 (-) Transcript_62214:69-2693(-)
MELVGAPVRVVGDASDQAAQDQFVLKKSGNCCKCTCLGCIGVVSLLVQIRASLLPVEIMAHEWTGPARPGGEHHLRLIFLTGSLSIVFCLIGLCLVRREKRVPGGCECLSCHGPWVPWYLFMLSGGSALQLLAITSVWRGDDPDLKRPLISIVCLLGTTATFAFSFAWSRAFVQQNTSLQQANNDAGNEAVLRHPKCDAHSGFTLQEARESKKFEMAYMVVEAIFVVVSILFPETSEIEVVPRLMRLHTRVGLMCFLFRLHRFLFATTAWRAGRLATAFDMFEFSWSACVLGWTGQASYASFLLNIMLAYMVLFVFPLRRARFTVPLCYGLYCTTVVTRVSLWSDPECDSAVYQTLLLLGIGQILNIFAKQTMHNSKWQTFLLIEEKTQLALDEKVLRFQAEFANEMIAGSLDHSPIDEQSSYLGDAKSLHAGSPKHNKQGVIDAVNSSSRRIPGHKVAPLAASIISAPAKLEQGLQQSREPLEEVANCLPIDALAWVEGEALPRALAELQPGSRVLCYDRLSGNLKHAALLDVQRKDGPVEWTTVTLADGATLEMTSDHPMQPVNSAASDGAEQATMRSFLSRPGLPVRAAELKPGQHSLMFLQVVPNMVESVNSHTHSKPRMALKVQQPERHALFVAPAGLRNDGIIQTMAVESVDVNTSSCVYLNRRRSFLEISQVCEDPPGFEECRAGSAPPSLHGWSCAESHVSIESGESVSVSSSLPSSERNIELVFGPLPVVRQDPMSLGSNDTYAAGVVGDSSESSYKLTDILRLRAAGLQSRGSVCHDIDQCVPCAHENRKQLFHKAPCFKGLFCERCHEEHTDLREAKRVQRRDRKRVQRRDRRRQMHQQGSKCLSSQGDVAEVLDEQEADEAT